MRKMPGGWERSESEGREGAKRRESMRSAKLRKISRVSLAAHSLLHREDEPFSFFV